MFEKLFDIGSIENFFETLTTSANQQATAAKETAAVVVEEKQNIEDSAVGYAEQANKQLERLKTIEAQGEEARRLAESSNIFDRITLIGEQILNPRAFTADGRTRQVSEIGQDLAARGQIHGINTELSVAKMQTAVAKENLVKAGLDADMSTLRAKVDGIQLMNQMMYQTETLRQQNLIQMDLPTIQKTLIGPAAQGGKYNIGGMEYAPAELQERAKALEVRDQLAMLSPQATDPEFATKLQVHHNLQLANYGLPELELLKANQYRMPDGTQVDPQVWDTHYTRQNQLLSDTIQKQVNEQTLQQQIPTMLKESMTLAESVGKYAAPGTPLAMAQQNFLAAANAAAQISELPEGQTPVGKITQVQTLGKAQEQLVKAVEVEATRRAAGDKDLALIYRDQMLGQEIQSSQVEDVLRIRYKNGKGFGDFLPTEDANRIRKFADQKYAELKQAAATNFADSNKPDKELREEAVNLALEEQRNEVANKGINVIQQRMVTDRKDHPAVVAGMVPRQIRDEMIRSADAAWKSVKEREGLTDEQVYMLRNGNAKEAGIPPERANAISDMVNAESVMQEYTMYEKQKPGLGYEVQLWLNKNLPEMARDYTQRLDPMQRALTSDSVLNASEALADLYTIADEQATRRGQEKAMELATGVKTPENMWPVLLQNGARLSDSQRATIYFDVIQPAIKQARAVGANDEVTTKSVFDALTQYKSPDPVTMSALKSFTRDLPEELDRFNLMWRAAIGSQLFMRKKNDPNSYTERLGHVIPWLNKDARQ